MAQPDPIVVEFTSAPEYVAVVRRVAEVAGARAGFSDPQCEELQIAVSELCNRLVTAGRSLGGDHPILRMQFSLESDRIVVDVGTQDQRLFPILARLLGERFVSFLMRRLVDRATCADEGRQRLIRLEKGYQKLVCPR